MAEHEVVHDRSAGCYQVDTAAGLARLTYVLRGDRLELVHTAVPAAVEGQGIASAMARRALDDARAAGHRVVPTCPYVAAYIERHPEYRALVSGA